MYLIDLSSHFWLQLILIGKICGAITALGGFMYSGFRGLQTVSTINKLATNHIPHIQQALDEHGTTMQEIKSDVRDVGTRVDGQAERLEDTKKAVHVLGESFLKHLENASKEAPRKRKRV